MSDSNQKKSNNNTPDTSNNDLVHIDIIQPNIDTVLDSKADSGQDAVTANQETDTTPSNQAVESTPTQKTTSTADTEYVPPTDVSLVCDNKKNKRRKRKSRTTSRRSYQFFLVLGLIVAFLLAMAYQTLLGHTNQPKGTLEIEEGQSYYGLLSKFQQDIPMFSSSLAKLYIKSRMNSPLQAGTYDLPENPNLLELLQSLEKGAKVDKVTVQIIEGKTAADLYRVLASTSGLNLEVLEKDGTPKADLKHLLAIDAVTPEGTYSNNLEGWFSPNTYYYAEGTTDRQILKDLYQRQQTALDEAWETRAENLPYESPYEALIMASIIEKETAIPSERNVVAAVFVNRLRQGMRLQTDPTIIYGMGERYDGNIRRKDIDEKTDYNTYQIDGLPPTPIALPSIASIKAALNPADSDALYFVATGNGGHKFSKTLAEHNRAVQEYLAVLRENRRNEANEAQ